MLFYTVFSDERRIQLKRGNVMSSMTDKIMKRSAYAKVLKRTILSIRASNREKDFCGNNRGRKISR